MRRDGNMYPVRCGAVIACGCLLLLGIATALAQPRTVTPEVSIRQDKASNTPLPKILESGRQFFALPYRGTHLQVDVTPEQTITDGEGEGAEGPRAKQMAATWPNWDADPPSTQMPFLRFNGLDAQSCFECHNSAGVYTPRGASAETIKPGGLGGGGGFSVALFVNAEWPWPQKPNWRIMNIIRKSPHVFGSGYLQRVAREMSQDLIGIKTRALNKAMLNPGTTFRAPLESKGVKFGWISVRCPVAKCAEPEFETQEIEGVSPDLIVRPFQSKGIAATLRRFVTTALNTHSSMQVVEIVGTNNDCDKDGLVNEMAVDLSRRGKPEVEVAVQQSLGNVLALTAFNAMVRPPMQVNSEGVQKGRKLFEHVGCDSCHVPELSIRNPLLHIELRDSATETEKISKEELCKRMSNPLLGSNTVNLAEEHPSEVYAKKTSENPTPECQEGYYCIKLSASGSDLPPDVLPRLPQSSDGSIRVPLYSDLKRHRMGDNLAQAGPEQGTDDPRIPPVPNNEWLTSKLWGVADASLWLHDGRARTLEEAILWHEGENSEANHVIEKYKTLKMEEKQLIITFLESLRLPFPGGTSRVATGHTP